MTSSMSLTANICDGMPSVFAGAFSVSWTPVQSVRPPARHVPGGRGRGFESRRPRQLSRSPAATSAAFVFQWVTLEPETGRICVSDLVDVAAVGADREVRDPVGIGANARFHY